MNLIATSFDTFVTETGQHILKTNSGKLVPFNLDVDKTLKESAKKQCVNFDHQHKSQVNMGSLPEFKHDDNQDEFLVRLEQYFDVNFD